jgi:hypothetical protein
MYRSELNDASGSSLRALRFAQHTQITTRNCKKSQRAGDDADNNLERQAVDRGRRLLSVGR